MPLLPLLDLEAMNLEYELMEDERTRFHIGEEGAAEERKKMRKCKISSHR